MSLEQFGYQQQLQRALKTRDLIIYGMIFMVPIAPFAVFGFVWKDSKGMVPLAYLIGLAGMLFTALSYAAMSRAFPLAGSVYTYVQRGLHEVAGFFSGWLILLDYILVPALLYLICAVALHPLLPGVPLWVWLVGFIVVNATINLLGIELMSRVDLGMLVMQLAVLALFLVAALIALYGGAGAGGLTLQPIYDPRVFSLSTVVGATSIAVLSFLGFDGISTRSEESVGNENAVGRATLWSLVLVGTLFIIQTWVATDLGRGMHFQSLETAFYEITERAGGPRLRLVIIVATVLGSLANAMAAQAAVARILFAMARDGKLPTVLARIHSKYKTPYVSTIAVAVVSLFVGLAFSNRLDDLSSIVNFGALTSFVLLHVAVIRHYFFQQRTGRWLSHLVFPLAGMSIIAYVLVEMDAASKRFGAAWLVIGVVYYIALSIRSGRRSGKSEVATEP